MTGFAITAPRRLLLYAVLWILLGGQAGDLPPQVIASRANDLYDAGRFLAAADMAGAANTVDGQAVAAKSLLAKLAYRPTTTVERLQYCERALAHAGRAITLNERSAEAHLQYVVALGYLGRLHGMLTAHFRGYANEARDHLERAIALDPDDPWALGLYGAWHLEIVRKGGSFAARTVYGARFDEGQALYRRALSLDPDNVVLHFEYGLALLAAGDSDLRDESKSALRQAVSVTPEHTVEGIAQTRAQHLLILLEKGDRRAIESAVGLYTDKWVAVARSQ